MTKAPPPWQAHRASNYDLEMTARCTSLLNDIISGPNSRQGILADPRNLHRDLFAAFTPPQGADYAGTYRGTPGTALADRRISAESQLELSTDFEFCLPGEVPARMRELLNNTRSLLADTKADDYGKLIALTYTFCWFGKIHPFLDGNGHVQRAIFAAMASEFGYPLSSRFALHPRPYDRLLASP